MGWKNTCFETADIAAPTLMGVMVPLLLNADDLILMSESVAGLPQQLEAHLQASVNSVNLQSTSARQRWWSLRLVAAMYHTLYLTVHLSKGWRGTSIWLYPSRHQRNEDWDSFLGGSCQKGIVCHAAAVSTFGAE